MISRAVESRIKYDAAVLSRVPYLQDEVEERLRRLADFVLEDLHTDIERRNKA